MSDQYPSEILQLPSSLIRTSPGFSLDIGCSTIKLIYRSKNDYKQGEPKTKELSGETGQVHVIGAISRDKLDDVIKLINERADILCAGDQPTKVEVTGLGCVNFKDRLQQGIKPEVKLEVKNEFDKMASSFHYLAKSQSEEAFCHPYPAKAQEMATMEVGAIMHWVQGEMADKFEIYPEVMQDWWPPEDNGFPAIVALCGSAQAFFKVNEDGSYKTMDGSVMGGRAFLGLTSLITGGCEDFSELTAMIERADGRTCDQYMDDLINMVSSEDDPYSRPAAQMGEKLDMVAMAFGKASGKNRDKVKDEDVVASLLRCFCLQYTQLGCLRARIENANNLYFIGNLINSDKARYLILREVMKQNAFVPKEKRVRVHFVRQGGNLGALGAFIGGKVEEAKTKQ